MKAKRPKVTTRPSGVDASIIIEVTGDSGIGLLIEARMRDGRLVITPYRADPEVDVREVNRVCDEPVQPRGPT